MLVELYQHVYLRLIQFAVGVKSYPLQTEKLPKLLTLLLGEEQKKKLYKHLEDENGHVSIEKCAKEVIEILNSNQSTKN